MEEARVGQKGRNARVWFERSQRPAVSTDRRCHPADCGWPSLTSSCCLASWRWSRPGCSTRRPAPGRRSAPRASLSALR